MTVKEDDYGLDVLPLLGKPLSSEVAVHLEQSVADAISRATGGERVHVTGAGIEGTVLHVNVTMPRDLAEDLGLVPVMP